MRHDLHRGQRYHQNQGHSFREKGEGFICDFDLGPVHISYPSQRLIPARHNQQNPLQLKRIKLKNSRGCQEVGNIFRRPRGSIWWLCDYLQCPQHPNTVVSCLPTPERSSVALAPSHLSPTPCCLSDPSSHAYPSCEEDCERAFMVGHPWTLEESSNGAGQPKISIDVCIPCKRAIGQIPYDLIFS